jgi:hypothetical protein
VEQEDVAKARVFLRALLFFSWMDARHELGEWAEEAIRAGMGDTLCHGVAAFFAVQRGAHDDGIAQAAQGLRLASRDGTHDWVCWYATTFGYWYSGRPSEGWEAETRLDAAVDGRREPYVAGRAALTISAHASTFDTQLAAHYLSRGRHLAAVLQNVSLERDADWAAGCVASAERRLDEARQHFARALDLGLRMEERFTTTQTRLELARVAIAAKLPEASTELRDALAELWTIRDWHFWQGAEMAAIALVKWDEVEAGAVIFGYLEARGVRHGTLHKQRRRALDQLEHLPDAAAWMHQGAAFERDHIVSYLFTALENLSIPESA